MKFRVVIVGCGNIFPMHAHPVMALDCCELVAICDNKGERAKEKAALLGCNAYSDYKEMYAKEMPDVVHVCTPHYLHAPMTIAALERGCHVLTEKPMATSYEDSSRMVEAAARAGKALGVVFQNRYNPGSVLAKQLLDSGEMGKVLGAKLDVTWKRTDEYYAKSDWKGTWEKEGGGVIIDQAIHTFDLLRWLVDSDVKYVDCHIANRTHRLIEVEDAAEGVIGFANGVLASFHTMNYHSEDADIRLELHCENGNVSITADEASAVLSSGRQYIARKAPRESFLYGSFKDYWGVGHIKQIKDFYASLEKEEVPYVCGCEALATMKLVFALYDSGKRQSRVEL